MQSALLPLVRRKHLLPSQHCPAIATPLTLVAEASVMHTVSAALPRRAITPCDGNANAVGAPVGEAVGEMGTDEGAAVGEASGEESEEGTDEGAAVGEAVGEVGTDEGAAVGATVGPDAAVGEGVGAAVGTSHAMLLHTHTRSELQPWPLQFRSHSV